MILVCVALVLFGGVSSESIQQCAVPPPSVLNHVPRCNSRMSRAKRFRRAQEVAHKVAPVIHFHPSETSFLADPKLWLATSRLFTMGSGPPEQLTLKSELLQAGECSSNEGCDRPTFASKLYKKNGLQQKVSTRTINKFKGAPFDREGRSTAIVYYTLTDDDGDRLHRSNGAMLFTYHLFYPWNGCSNQAVTSQPGSNLLGGSNTLHYYYCPDGAHEGDWEYVSVLVCVDSLQILRVQLSQHGWLRELDCTKGECQLDKFGRPQVYAALFSHANYPSPANFWVYETVELNSIPIMKGIGLDSLFVGDRVAGSSKSFVPTVQNIKYLPRQQQLLAGDSSYDWARYRGKWGVPDVTSATISITCVNDAGARGTCPPGQQLIQLLKYLVPVQEGEATLQWQLDGNVSKADQSVVGPLKRPYAWKMAYPTSVPAYTVKRYNMFGIEALSAGKPRCP